MAWWSAHVGWLATSDDIYRTTDGGHVWEPWYRASAQYQGLVAAGPSTLWAATPHRVIELTGGLRAQRVASLNGLDNGAPLGPSSVSVLPGAGAANQPAMAGGSGTVAHAAALPVPPRPAVNHTELTDLVFPTAKTGYVLDRGTIKRIVTGSAPALSLVTRSPRGFVNSMAWPSVAVGYAAVGRDVYRTTDGGRRWARAFAAPVNRTAGPWIGWVAANSPQEAFLLLTGLGAAANSGYVLWQTQDGGAHWTAIAFDAYTQPLDAPAVTAGVAQAVNQMMIVGVMAPVGTTGLVVVGDNLNTGRLVGLVYAGGRWHSATYAALSNPSAPVATSYLVFPTAAAGWLAGTRRSGAGALLQLVDGGRRWAPAFIVGMGGGAR